MSIEEIIQRLRDAPNRAEIERATGLKYMYLSRLAWGKMVRPSAAKIDELRNYFLAQDTKQ